MAEATIDHLADDVAHLREADRQLAVDIRDITAGLASVRTELRLLWRIGAGVAAALASVSLWTASQTFTLSGRVGELSAEVRANAAEAGRRFDQLEKRMDRTDAKLDKIIDRLDQDAAKGK